MTIYIDEKEGFKGARKITEIIASHGRHMAVAALDRALDAWEILMKSGLTRSATCRQDNQKEEPMEKSRQEALMDRGRAFVKAGHTPREAARLALEIEQKTGVNQGAAAPSAPAAPVMPRAAQVAPKQALGPAALGYERRDLSKLTPHQVAALKAGVDLDKVSAAELTSMNRSQMETLAQRHLLEAVAEQRPKQPVQDVRQWGNPNGFWR